MSSIPPVGRSVSSVRPASAQRRIVAASSTPTKTLHFPAFDESIGNDYFTLTNLDETNYVSSLKSDLFQIQMHLEKLQRENDRSQAKVSSSSRLRSEINSIKQSSNDIDTILEQTGHKDIAVVKLRLLELLCSKMIQLELRILSFTDRQASKNATIPYGFPSQSRLPSFLALTERLSDLSSQLDSKSSGNNNLLPEIESKILHLATSVGVSNSEIPSMFLPTLEEGDELMKESPEMRFKQLIRFIGVINKHSNALLEQVRESKESVTYLKQSLNQAGSEISVLKSEVTRTKLAGTSQNTSQVQQLEDELRKVSLIASRVESVEAELQVSRDLVNQIRQEQADSTAQFDKELSILQKALKQLQSQLEDEMKQRRISEYNLYQEKEQAIAKVEKNGASNLLELRNQQELANNLSTEVHALKLQVATSQSTIEEQQLLIADLKQKLLQSQVDQVDSIATNSESDSSALQSQVVKLKKQFSSLESYHRDAVLDHEKQLKDAKLELSKIREELNLESENKRDLLKLKQEQIDKLTMLLKKKEVSNDESDSFEEVLLEEIRVMKASYELKINSLKESNSKLALEHNQTYRNMLDKLSGENRILENKLKQYQQ